MFVEQAGQFAQDAALGLTAKPKQDKVVLREDGVRDLRNHGIVVADDSGEYTLPALDLGQEILAHFALYRTLSRLPIVALPQFADSPRHLHGATSLKFQLAIDAVNHPLTNFSGA